MTGIDIFVFSTVEPVLRDRPFCQAKAVSQDRWSFTTGFTLSHIGKEQISMENKERKQKCNVSKDFILKQMKYSIPFEYLRHTSLYL